MKPPRYIAVIDIGKTNAKLALVDLETLAEIDVVTRPNTVLSGPPWPHFDVEGHWAFLLEALGRFHRNHGVDAISVTTHGASVALLGADGRLAAPILDYEHDGPEQTAAEYDAIRPPFAETGSPRLAGGLNMGAQLFWQFREVPSLLERTARIMPYPQYWGHRLTGIAASDVTSIGCHTDLWMPNEAKFSSLVATMGITAKIAPVHKSTDTLGPILPEIAAATGLPSTTPVAVGIHDSNASLFPHILTQKKPFSVISTGTWVIAMAVGGTEATLDPARDTLVNVNALGHAVPSARFMGGREYEVIQQCKSAEASHEDIIAAVEKGIMLLPAVEGSTGPFQGRIIQWIGSEPAVGSGLREVALSYYLALMTDTCLRLTGATGPTIVEGPFARNAPYLAMLAAASDRSVLQSQSATGTSLGAALLFGNSNRIPSPLPMEQPPNTPQMAAYAAHWRKLADHQR